MTEHKESVVSERPLSEGDQIKAAIRELFVESRRGSEYSDEAPLRVRVVGVNGVAEKTLNLYKHPTRHGAVVMWYE